MRVWIFSDLHLTDENESLYQSFLKALDEPNGPNSVVVFAGDIFDLFVGQSSLFASKHTSFFKKLLQLHLRQVQLFYIEGNHDFHFGKLLKSSGVKLVQDELVVNVPETKKNIYIAHGDLVDQADTNYLRLRKTFRHPFIRTLIKAAPGELIKKIAEQLSRDPKQQAAEIPALWSSADRDRLRSKFRSFARQKVATPTSAGEKINYVVLGHCHDLDEEEPFYWNMGYPPVHRQFLFYDSQIDQVKRRNF